MVFGEGLEFAAAQQICAAITYIGNICLLIVNESHRHCTAHTTRTRLLFAIVENGTICFLNSLSESLIYRWQGRGLTHDGCWLVLRLYGLLWFFDGLSRINFSLPSLA